MTSKPSHTDSDGSPWLRIVWAVITGALTLVMLFIDGVYTLQAATVMVGLPLSVLVYLVMFSLWKVLRTEKAGMESRQAALPALLTSRVRESGERGSWRQRLHKRMSYADEERARTFVETVAAPAIEEVAGELTTMGADVSCHRGVHPDSSVPFVDLIVTFQGAEDFKYQAYPVAYSVPSFAANLSTVRDVYYRIEIFSLLGSRGRDIMGYTKDQVITDVLDAYDAHIMYLTMSQEIGTATGTIPVTAPETWTDTDHVADQRTVQAATGRAEAEPTATGATPASGPAQATGTAHASKTTESTETTGTTETKERHD